MRRSEELLIVFELVIRIESPISSEEVAGAGRTSCDSTVEGGAGGPGHITTFVH